MSYFANYNKINIDIDGKGVVDNLCNLTNRVKIKDTLINNLGYYDKVTVMEGERPDALSQRLYGTPEYHWTFFLLNDNISNIWSGWPMSNAQLVEYCTNKYQYTAALTDDNIAGKFKVGETISGVLSNAVGTIREIHVNNYYLTIEVTSGTFTSTGESLQGAETGDTMIATSIDSRRLAPKYHKDVVTGEIVPKRTAGTAPYTFLEWETARNDENRDIKVIKPNHVASVAAEFKREIAK